MKKNLFLKIVQTFIGPKYVSFFEIFKKFHNFFKKFLKILKILSYF